MQEYYIHYIIVVNKDIRKDYNNLNLETSPLNVL